MKIVNIKCTKSNNYEIFTVGGIYQVESLNCSQKTVYAKANDGSIQPISTFCLSQGSNFWFTVVE